jgi:RNA polymerase-binding protein DksA
MTALTKSELDQFRQQLKAQYADVAREVNEALADSSNQHRIDLLNSEPGDSGDEAMANALADINVATVDHHVRDVRDIKAALQRIEDGSFGSCIDCGDEIAVERLRAYPTAKRCLQCQEKREREYASDVHPSL